jgi:hypothetical protein
VDEHDRIDEHRVLSVQLDLHLDHQPISGRLRTAEGAEEPFVGWLGFIEALKSLHELGELSRDRPGSAHLDMRP